ncbi:MAG: EAL domain-containing protein [Gammaproteobacteria bacterium]|nr:EAL domain-containing protein [Gammaproteobacteria bacterium]
MLLGFRKNKNLISIQTQYIIITLILAFVVILMAIVSYNDSFEKTSKFVEKVDHISSLLEKTANIRKHFHNAKSQVDNFMLEPEINNYDLAFAADLSQIQSHLQQLAKYKEIQKLPSYILINQISNKLDKFKSKVESLFIIRVNANLQFPALNIATNHMRPVRTEIISIFDVIINEFVEEETSFNTHILYEVLKAQKIWISAISEFRLYLANRLGSFDEKSLFYQEEIMISYLEDLKDRVKHLVEYKLEGVYGFEGETIIDSLPEKINVWQQGLQQVIYINHTSKWRKDSQLMRDEIIPLLDDIEKNLNEIDNDLSNINNLALSKLNRSKTDLRGVLMWLVILFIVYILLSLSALRFFIIKPITLIASALKSKAFGRHTLESLSIKNTRETQSLIDAFNEMSNQVYKRQQALEHQALNDSLTSLPNRLMLHERLDYHLKIAHREKQSLVLMFLDLNYFKDVNDTLGHHIGDLLLIQVGKRLKSHVREMDTVARLGGDEFAILLPNINKENVIPLANKINQAIELPFAVENHNLQISVSIGISIYPNDADISHLLMQYADIAMYHSKNNKLDYSFYDSTPDINTLDRLSLSSELKNAFENNELELYYQPKYDLNTEKLFGVEVLLRWNHESLGFISPETIINTAIKIGLINKLSQWIITTAFKECSQCMKKGNAFNIAINLEVQNLQDESLHVFINDALSEQQILAEYVIFEVTESAMMTHPEQSIDMLNLLKHLGVTISIDDFGTGFSSLAYIKQLPVAELKIDKSFISNLEHDKNDQVIVISTIQLAHNLGLKVVAEGVETKETWELLKSMNCNYAQGYFMSKPLPIDKLKKLFK